MEDHDKTRGEIHGLVLFIKHVGNNTVYSMEETIKQCPVIKEKLPEVFVDGENTMPVGDIDQFKGHGGSTPHGIEIPASRAEAAVAAERDEFQFTTVRTAVHGTAKSRVAAVDHFIHVFCYRLAWM